MPMKRLTAATLAALVAALTLAACGSSAPSGAPAKRHVLRTRQTVTQPATASTPATTPTGGATSTVQSPATSPPTTTGGTVTSPATGTGGTSTTPTGVAAACVAADLAPTFLGTNGAAGTIAIGFALTNTSSAPCHTYGWPGVQLESATGAPLPTNATRTTSDPIGQTPASKLVLQPGQRASFRLLLSDFAKNGGANCPNASQLQIIAPDDTATLSVRIGGGIPACGRGSVSPLMAGTGAWPKE